VILISSFSPQDDPVLNKAFALAMDGLDSHFIRTAVNCLLVSEAAMFLISVIAVGIQPETKNALFAPFTTPLDKVNEISHNKIFLVIPLKKGIHPNSSWIPDRVGDDPVRYSEHAELNTNRMARHHQTHFEILY
jgi:hypothetical protein